MPAYFHDTLWEPGMGGLYWRVDISRNEKAIDFVTKPVGYLRLPAGSAGFFSRSPHNFTSGNRPDYPDIFSSVLLADLIVTKVIGWGKIILHCRAGKACYLASKTREFLQTEQKLKGFSMRTQSGLFTGFSYDGPDPKRGIRAHFGRIFPQGIPLPVSRVYNRVS